LGLYFIFDHNAEANERLTHYNVLFVAIENEIIIFVFEDIRRDLVSCDNDFRDAIIYICASLYSFISTNNFSEIAEVNDVTSFYYRGYIK